MREDIELNVNTHKPAYPLVCLFFGVLFIFPSCKKDGCPPPPYPPAISGYNMTAKNGSTLLTYKAMAVFSTGRKAVNFDCLWETNNSNDVNNQLYIESITLNKGVIGTYSLGSYPDASYVSENGSGPLYRQSSVIFDYNTDATHTGTLSITAFDSINHTISGTFSFTAYGSYIDQCGTSHDGTVDITGGTFTGLPTN